MIQILFASESVWCKQAGQCSFAAAGLIRHTHTHTHSVQAEHNEARLPLLFFFFFPPAELSISQPGAEQVRRTTIPLRPNETKEWTVKISSPYCWVSKPTETPRETLVWTSFTPLQGPHAHKCDARVSGCSLCNHLTPYRHVFTSALIHHTWWWRRGLPAAAPHALPPSTPPSVTPQWKPTSTCRLTCLLGPSLDFLFVTSLRDFNAQLPNTHPFFGFW